MRFMIIRKADAETEAGVMPGPELLAAMGKYNEKLIDSGVMQDGAGLRPTSRGSLVRLSGGKFSVSDGPFAEAKEVIGGFSIWQVESKKQALDLLRDWPELDGHGEGELELWELYEPTDLGDEARDEQALFSPERKPGTTRFMVILSGDAYTEAGHVTTPEGKKVVARMGELMTSVASSGALLGGAGLKPSRKAARIQRSGGKQTVTDGPFAEAKEVIAGYTLLQGTRDEAVEFAKRWLEIHVDGCGLDSGEIQIRPLFELEDFAR